MLYSNGVKAAVGTCFLGREGRGRIKPITIGNRLRYVPYHGILRSYSVLAIKKDMKRKEKREEKKMTMRHASKRVTRMPLIRMWAC